MLEAMVVMFMGTIISLGEFDTSERYVWAACCHRPYQLTNPTAVRYVHSLG